MNEVFDALVKLATRNEVGPDKVSPLVLQKCVATLAEYLIFIFNKSLSLEVFSERWKTFKIRFLSVQNFIAFFPQLTFSKSVPFKTSKQLHKSF